MDDETPRWERGHRVHGYWLGMVRVGWVGLPQGRGSASKEGYGWECDPPGQTPVTGHADTLKKAKRAVEDEYRRH
jgi:hypothetical protein